MNAETIGNIEHMITGWELYANKVGDLGLCMNVEDQKRVAYINLGCACARGYLMRGDIEEVESWLNVMARTFAALKDSIGDGNRSPVLAAYKAGTGCSCAGDCE